MYFPHTTAISTEDSPLWKDFKPDEEYGNSAVIFWQDEECIAIVKQVCERDMQTTIPLKFRHKIEYRMKLPTLKGRAVGIAWHYHPNNIGINRNKGPDKIGGYSVI